MEQDKKEMYLNIISGKNANAKVLKCDIADAIETLEGSELAELPSQNGKILEVLKKFSSVVKDKIILAQYKISNNSTILYWCPCNIEDILAISGIDRWSDEKQRYYITRIERENQISFLGKDIKRSVANVENANKVLSDFIASFVNTDKPLGDLNYYVIYSKNDRENNIQSLKCARNIDLSPRKAPANNVQKDEAAVVQ